MPEIATQEPNDWLAVCEELAARGGLTPWEEEFIHKISLLVTRGVELTVAQQRKLQQIYEERV